MVKSISIFPRVKLEGKGNRNERGVGVENSNSGNRAKLLTLGIGEKVRIQVVAINCRVTF